MAKLQDEINGAKVSLAEHDQADYVGLGAQMQRIGGLETELSTLEERWLELGEMVE